MSKTIIGDIKTWTDENGNKRQMVETEVKFDVMQKKGWRRTDIKTLCNMLSNAFHSKKMDIFNYLVQNMDGKNRVIVTQKNIETILNISTQTVSTAFIDLQASGLIKKINNYYVINTRVISTYGKAIQNNNLSSEYGFYEEERNKEEKPSKKIEKKLKAIARIQSDIDKIQAEEKFNKRNEKLLNQKIDEIDNYDFPDLNL